MMRNPHQSPNLNPNTPGRRIKRPFRFGGRTKYGKRHLPGEMNQTESAYSDLLEIRRLAGEIQLWQFEPIKLQLARDLTYTPDFAILLADGSLEMIDVKGSGPIDDKSIVKIKMAAKEFPYFLFAMEQKQTVKQGGGWKRKEY